VLVHDCWRQALLRGTASGQPPAQRAKGLFLYPLSHVCVPGGRSYCTLDGGPLRPAAADSIFIVTAIRPGFDSLIVTSY
jgi:hypothetical protein